jgi:hypothetical protein
LTILTVFLTFSPGNAAFGDHSWSRGYAAGGGGSVDGTGHVASAGTFYGPVDFGRGALSSTDLLDVQLDGGTVTRAVKPVPLSPELKHNVPNPFNPSTTIRFTLRNAAYTSPDVFDERGRRIATLMQQQMGIGSHTITWNGTNNRCEPVASGVYYYLLSAAGGSKTKQIVLVK